MSNLGPPVPPSGPRPCHICIVGEAPGEEESSKLKPFVGPSGWELRRMLKLVGVDLSECFVTNVFNQQPPANDLAQGYGVEREHPNAAKDFPPLTSNPTTFLDIQHLHHLPRLYAEIAACRPNVIIALGNTACWALLGSTGINALRGTVHLTDVPGLNRQVKVLPTYHPQAVVRQWSLRTVAIADFAKALNESHEAAPHFDNTELWLAPTLDDLYEFGRDYMETSNICATDVETKRGQITCVSFAPTPQRSLVVPFWIDGENPNYWGTPEEEGQAWSWIARWVEDPDLIKVTQNGLFDLQYFIKHGMKPKNFSEDTMLAHHSLYSELNKGLGFLGSLYANVPSWKSMRTFTKEELKRDE